MKIITILGIKLAGLREMLEARVGIEAKTMLKAQKLLILLNAKNAKNTESARAHGSLGYLTPREFARRIAALRSPTAPCAPQSGELAEVVSMILRAGARGQVADVALLTRRFCLQLQARRQ